MLYFAYGSNMNPQRIKERLPKAIDLGVATLHGYKLTERLYADIDYSPASVVHGVLYYVSRCDVFTMDRYEGYPTIYDRSLVKVCYNGKPFLAITYIMTKETKSLRSGIAYPKDYREICSIGARVHGIPNGFKNKIYNLF